MRSVLSRRVNQVRTWMRRKRDTFYSFIISSLIVTPTPILIETHQSSSYVNVFPQLTWNTASVLDGKPHAYECATDVAPRLSCSPWRISMRLNPHDSLVYRLLWRIHQANRAQFSHECCLILRDSSHRHSCFKVMSADWFPSLKSWIRVWDQLHAFSDQLLPNVRRD